MYSGVIIGCLSLYLVIDSHFLSEAQIWNLPLAEYLQSFKCDFIDVTCIVLKQFGTNVNSGMTPIFLSIGLLNYFINSNQIKSILFVNMLIICNYFVSVLKNVYQQPRPVFLYDEIHGQNCSLEYGSPSGHGKANILSPFNQLLLHVFV